MRKTWDIRDGLRMRNVYIEKKRIYIKKGGTRGSGNAAEPLRPMASELFGKKVRAVRFQSRSAAALATSAKREVPRANGRAAAGSAADFLR